MRNFVTEAGASSAQVRFLARSFFFKFMTAAFLGLLCYSVYAEPPVYWYYLSDTDRNYNYNMPANYRQTADAVCSEFPQYVFDKPPKYGWIQTSGVEDSVWHRCRVGYLDINGVARTIIYSPVIPVTWCANNTAPDTSKAWERQCATPYGNTGAIQGTSIPVNQVDDQSCAVGNPCFVGSGIKQQREVDYVGADPQALSLARTYRSSYLAGPTQGFGSLWMHEWQRKLDFSLYSGTSPEIIALRPDGSFTKFSLVENAWVTEGGSHYESLAAVKDSNGVVSGWRISDARSGRFENYARSGKLVSVRERNGWTTTLIYSGASTPTSIAPIAGLLIEVKGSFGRSLSFTYDAKGRIATVVTPSGSAIGYSYDGYGMLSSVTYPDGTTRRYLYENLQFPWALTGITDEKGVRFATYGYDLLGRATSTEHAGGVDKFQLNFLGTGQTSVTTADGTSRTFTSELQGNVLRATGASAPCPACGDIAKAVSYDAAGNVASRKDFADKETRYSHDVLGRETQRIEGYGTADAKTTTTEWHPTWNLPLKVAEPGHFEYFSYDASGQMIGYVRYDTTDPTGSQGVNVTPTGPVTSTGWTYDSNGLKSATIEMVDGTVVGQWTYTYDSAGNLLTITDAAGRKAQAVQYDAAGRLLDAITLDGDHIRYQYDTNGRPVSYEVNGFTLKYEYDNIGFLIAVRGPDGTLYRGYTYDSAHRLVEITDASAPTMVSDISNPFAVNAAARESNSDVVKPSGLAASWKRLVAWILGWIAPAHAQQAPPVPRPVPPGGSSGQAPNYLSSPESDLYGSRGNPNAILQLMNEGWNAMASAMEDGASSLRELATRIVKPLTCDEDPRCTLARQNAQSRYHKLVYKRLDQYLKSPTPTKGHYDAVIQLQNGLKEAIGRVKLYCKTLPPELPEWERAANEYVPIRY